LYRIVFYSAVIHCTYCTYCTKAEHKGEADLKKICISLVSEQTIPNTLFIMENKADFDQYYFITTQKMESFSKSDSIIDACALSKNKTTKIMVVEDSLKDLFNKLSTIKISEDDDCFINLTGGTKLMTLCVYKYFFENHKDVSSFFYMPIGKNSIVKVHPFDPSKKYIFPMEYRLDLKRYLKAVGLKIDDNSKFSSTVADFQTANKIFNFYLDNELNYEAVSTLRKLTKAHGDQPHKINISGDRKIVNLINLIGSFNNSQLTKKEAEYINGCWFEEYIYYSIKTQLRLNDNSIATSLIIANNEFDVMFIVDNSLFVIECKTALKDSTSGKSIINETFYKAVALNKKFGLQTKSFVFTLDTGLRTLKGDFKENIQKRLDEYKIKLADRKVFICKESEKEFISNITN